MDADQNGQVSRAEFTSYKQARFDRQAKAMDEAFVELDKNKDGGISKAEAAAVPVIATAFDGLDANKDGKLSSAELRDALVKSRAAEAEAQ